MEPFTETPQEEEDNAHFLSMTLKEYRELSPKERKTALRRESLKYK